MIVHNLLFCAQTLYINFVSNTFLLVSSLESEEITIVLCERSRPKKRIAMRITINYGIVNDNSKYFQKQSHFSLEAFTEQNLIT